MTIPWFHLVATVFMTGVIVFVQLVHYPLMSLVGASGFTEYETQHAVRTSWVVIPPMLMELATAVWIAAVSWGSPDAVPALFGLALLAVIWVSTAAFQAPAHGRLARGFDAVIHRRLVASNWIRTAAWVTRVPIAVVLVL